MFSGKGIRLGSAADYEDTKVRKDEPKKKDEFSLLEHQMPHFERIMEYLSKRNGYVDTSTMGCGKTFVTVMVAFILGLKILVFCPKTVKSIWRKTAKLAGVQVVDTITFQSCSSKLRKQPKHGYLHKTARTIGKSEKEHYYFSATKKYHEVLGSGVLVVVDEVQFTRNNTAQYRAIQTLIRKASISTRSKFALLSASPIDKPGQAINLMRLMNVITQEELFIRNRPTGWRELVSYCKEKDPYQSESILSEKTGTRKADYYECALKLYSGIVRKDFCSAMPLKIDAECDAKNGYYNLEPEMKERFIKAIIVLESAAVRTASVVKPRNAEDAYFAELTKAMVAIEKCKIGIFERLAKKYLEDDRNAKVVIGVHYYDVLNALARNLGAFCPLILCGEIEDEAEREAIVDEFNNDKNSRLLLCISKVGGVGISLHDITGLHPRVMLLSPDFNLIDTHQATGRVYRVGTKSKTTIRLIYVNSEGSDERNIHRILAKKSETLRSVLEEYTRHQILLPIDYEEEREE